MRYVSLLSAALLACATASAGTAASDPPHAYRANPAFQKARTEAEGLSRSAGDRNFAAGSWRKANTIAGGHCIECYEGMVNAALAVSEPKDALKYAIEFDAAMDKPADKSTAELYQGQALLRQAGTEKPKPALLEAAHDAFTKAIANDPSNDGCYYLDGTALALLGKNEEASAAFHAYVAHAKGSSLATRARHLAERPELVRLKMAPPVVVTTADGRRFNLDDLGGRVVLIDFWATWCGPCNRELPHLQRLAKQFENQPFEIISISSDSDEGKWKSFIATHGMTWNQYLDRNGSIGKAFAVRSIPHYFIIDSDGVLTSEDIGTDNNIDGKLKKLVKRAAETGAKLGNEVASLR